MCALHVIERHPDYTLFDARSSSSCLPVRITYHILCNGPAYGAGLQGLLIDRQLQIDMVSSRLSMTECQVICLTIMQSAAAVLKASRLHMYMC